MWSPSSSSRGRRRWCITRCCSLMITAGPASSPPPATRASRATPHMHLVGKQMKVTATMPDGSIIPLIHITDWDFRWQDQYRYVEPIKLPQGTVLNLEAIYDNSANNPDNPNSPPQRVVRGEQT